MMEFLPRQIILDILSRLPITSLLQRKLVCRAWKHFAEDPLLVGKHFSRSGENDPCLILHCDYPTRKQLYSVELSAHCKDSQRVNRIHLPPLPEFDVLGSCKGLLCLCDSSTKSSLYIYSTFARDYIELRLPKSLEFQNQDVVLGFDFHETTKEYKVIKVVYLQYLSIALTFPPYPPPFSRIRCSDFGHSGQPCLEKYGENTLPSLSVAIASPVQWKTFHWISWPQRHGHGTSLISFYLTDEQFREVPKPECDDLNRCKFDLVVLGGCLSVAFQPSHWLLEIWVMKDYDVKESWVKEFSIGVQVPRGLEQDVAQSLGDSNLYPVGSFVRVLCLLNNGDILLQLDCKSRVLVSYDPKNGTFKNLLFHGMPNWFQAFVHEGNLTLLNA